MSAKKTDLFDDEVKEVVEEIEEVQEVDDLQEGMTAELDPKSAMSSASEALSQPGEDVVKKSLDSDLSALGRDTAEKLNKQPKFKVMIPMKELNPQDTFVVVGTNGWNMQIKRGEPVLLPEDIITRLSESGEAPTFVR